MKTLSTILLTLGLIIGSFVTANKETTTSTSLCDETCQKNSPPPGGELPPPPAPGGELPPPE